MEHIAVVDELISEARRSGRISPDTIARSLSHLELEAQEVAGVYRRISEAGIQIEDGDAGLPVDANTGLIGEYLARVERTPALSAERERYLVELIQVGGMAEEIVARKLLLETNQKTAIRVAGHYRGEGIDIALLLGEANNGMLGALDSYDPRGGYSFGAWATWWAHRAIQGMLRDRSKRVQLTPDKVEAVNQILRVRELLTEEWVKEPTVEEIAGRMGIDPDRVGELMRLA